MQSGNGDRLDNLIQVLVESNARAEERFRQHEERIRLSEERLHSSEERISRLEDAFAGIQKILEKVTKES